MYTTRNLHCNFSCLNDSAGILQVGIFCLLLQCCFVRCWSTTVDHKVKQGPAPVDQRLGSSGLGNGSNGV